MSREASPLGRWVERLESYSPHEIDLGLDRVRAVLDRLELPRPGLVLHVAGTNGKGSSVALLSRLLERDGACVGAYTSPHLRRYNERIAIDGLPASDEEIVAAFERVDAVRDGLALTYFEFGTLAALVVFAARGVDRAVLEIGMGGRLDAVNAVDPDGGIITNVSLDHCDWLGNDVESIAAEKAGIMRRGSPTVFASRDVPAAITRTAEETGAKLILAGRDYDWAIGDPDWQFRGRSMTLDGLVPPALPGRHQYENAAGVLALLEATGLEACLERSAVNEALGKLGLDGRMQRIRRDREWLLDVAHNAAAAEALAATLGAAGGRRARVAIVGMRDDKDVESLVTRLAPVVDAWIGVAVDDARAIDVSELARRVANATGKACLEAPSVDAAMAAARERSEAGDRVLVTGSFYLVAPALDALDL
jgi:dihydrofolate synthase/folylpolyglutamate synthase